MSFVKVSNISALVTEENLKELFECCGEILRLKLKVEEEEKRVCCIEFPDETHGQTALMLHGTEIGDSKLVVTLIDKTAAKTLLSGKSSSGGLTEYEKACQFMQEMMEGPNGKKGVIDDEVKRTVYVGNLSRLCTPQILRDEFSSIGEVVYIKFSQGNNDFRYAFVEFATEGEARQAFSLHGRVVAGSTIKIGTAHNPIFKDDISDQDNPLALAAKHAARLQSKVKHTRGRDRRSRDRDRGRRRRRRRRRSRSRSKDRARDKDMEREKMREREKNATGIKPESNKGKEPQMFWDGFQWHFNDTKIQDLEEHVTSVIRSDVDIRRMDPVDTETKMQNAAAQALKALQRAQKFTSYG